MKQKIFSYIVGNPPYQNPNEKVDSSKKLYLQITQKIINRAPVVAFVTPIALAKITKRFSLNDYHIQVVNYDADDYFSVGVQIMFWIKNDLHRGLTKVTQKTDHYQKYLISPDRVPIMEIFEKLKANRPTPGDFIDVSSVRKPGQGQYQFLVNHFRNKITWTDFEPLNYKNDKLVILPSRAYPGNLTFFGKGIGVQGIQIVTDGYTSQEKDNLVAFFGNELIINLEKAWRKYNQTGFNLLTPLLPRPDRNKVYTTTMVESLLNLTPKQTLLLAEYTTKENK